MASSNNAYESVKPGRLRLKGKRQLFKSDKQKKRRKLEDTPTESDPDTEQHGGWRQLINEEDLSGGINIAIECNANPRTYLAAMGNGRFTTGGPHPLGEGPSPEEIVTLIKMPDDMLLSLKTGYGKYVGVDAQGSLIATADAIGNRERLIAVFQDGKTALQSVSNNLFLSTKPDADGYITVTSRKAEAHEMIILRTNAKKKGPVDWRSEEDKRSAAKCETSYVKMYQHSKVPTKDRQIAIDLNDKSSIRRAREEGNLHEALLERRIKTKSDKYC